MARVTKNTPTRKETKTSVKAKADEVPSTGNGGYDMIFKGISADRLRDTIRHHIMSFQGRDPDRAGNEDTYRALAYTLRDALMYKWIKSQKDYYAKAKKRVYYMSLEFLVGRSLSNAVINLGMQDKL